MRTRLLATCVMLTSVTGATAISDVKETVRITVTGESAHETIVVDDPTLLAASHVFSGQFIGAPAAPPDARIARYRLSFDIQTRDGIRRDAYVIHYVKGQANEEGWLYLPGEGDAEYRANIGTILRTGRDGAWHHATPAWACLLNAFLPAD